MPHLETVARLAAARSWTSNRTLIEGLSLILSPFIKDSIILSSSTVFMFSIQRASTGPSKTHQLLRPGSS